MPSSEGKAAFDPPMLLNPTKAILTLQRCAEYGHACTSSVMRSRSLDLPRF